MILTHPYIATAFQIAAGACACAAMAVMDRDRASRLLILASTVLLWAAIALGQMNANVFFYVFPEVEPTGITLWQDTVNKSPEKLRPRINLARAYHLAIRQNPAYAQVAYREYGNAMLLTLKARDMDRQTGRNIIAMNMGDLLIRMAVEAQAAGRTEEAAAFVEQARSVMLKQWEASPNHPGLATNIGKIFVMVGHGKVLTGQGMSETALAEAGLREILIGIAFFDAGLIGGAGLNKSIDDGSRSFPDMDKAALYWNKGEAFRILGQCGEMTENYRMAARISPDFQNIPLCQGAQ